MLNKATHSVFRFLLPTLLLLVSDLGGASAEFVRTRESGVYEHTGLHAKVVLSLHDGARGIFVMVGPKISPQEFNLEKTPKAGVRHIFIRFDPDSQPPVYSELLIGGRSYKIMGNLTIDLAGVSIGVDNTNPYLSIVAGDGISKSAAIIGFSGVTEVVRADGAATAVLAANQLSDSLANMFQPYTVGTEELLLNGKPVTNPVVGVSVTEENDCLKPTAVVITQRHLREIQEEKTESARLARTNKVLKEIKKRSPLSGKLILKRDQESAVLLDVLTKDLLTITPTSADAARKRVCVLSELELD